MNYFDAASYADRYSKGRPDFHSLVIQRIAERLRLSTPLNRALDIACGTGLSTKALLRISGLVFGTDISAHMISHAPRLTRIQYALAEGENQPFKGKTFDLITVALGVHWLRIDDFLLEARRLLRPRGWLVHYNNYFISEMEGVEEFRNWFPEVYLSKYPSPPRDWDFLWTNENLTKLGFEVESIEEFKNPVSLTREELILYFTTQSNITRAVESDEATFESVEQWLRKELSSFFKPDSPRTINYQNRVIYLRKK